MIPVLPPVHQTVLALLCEVKLKVRFSGAVGALPTPAVRPQRPLAPHHPSEPLLCGLGELKPHLTNRTIHFQAAQVPEQALQKARQHPGVRPSCPIPNGS